MRKTIIAVTGLKPYSVFPDLPAVVATVPGFESGSATRYFAPARAPVNVEQRLNREAVRHLARPEVWARFSNTGAEAAGRTPGELAALVRTDIARSAKIVRDAGIKVE